MKFLILASLLITATALPIPLEQPGGSSSSQRFNVYPPQEPAFFPQIPFPLPPQLPLIPIPLPFPFLNNPNQVLTLDDLIAVNSSALLIYKFIKNITFNTLYMMSQFILSSIFICPIHLETK
ncbi:secretory calcium-binding phosphoprotein proline-glutamine-rich protein 1 [Camelus bactrianus]|uniref:Secretory calcium-binding phosphoprotein proline-glutamine-rich protein 1 n=1 Tax=Camelus bactrianus TaxID=9837 RepID=A0AC58PFV6_CAMBA